jgi:putative transposase
MLFNFMHTTLIGIKNKKTMIYQANQLYHIYNRGNNHQRIFFTSENYLFFLRKVRHFLVPHCDIVAYCLMPNHFHFLVNTDERSIQNVGKHSFSKEPKNVISEGIRMLLSSYAQAINKQEKRDSSLFTQNTNAKLIDTNDYAFTCFQYIHQNPLNAGLVNKLEDWHCSSFRDYAGFRDGTLCNKEIAKQFMGINEANFYQESYSVISEELLRHIW